VGHTSAQPPWYMSLLPFIFGLHVLLTRIFNLDHSNC
jgi:hypothetical protein